MTDAFGASDALTCPLRRERHGQRPTAGTTVGGDHRNGDRAWGMSPHTLTKENGNAGTGESGLVILAPPQNDVS